MITDAVIHFFQSIVQFIYNAIPDAQIVAAGNGAASGTACCATLFIDGVALALGITTDAGPLIQSGASTGVSAIANSPIALIVNWYYVGFFLGCAMSMLVAFIVIRIMLIFWQQVKW